MLETIRINSLKKHDIYFYQHLYKNLNYKYGENG